MPQAGGQLLVTAIPVSMSAISADGMGSGDRAHGCFPSPPMNETADNISDEPSERFIGGHSVRQSARKLNTRCFMLQVYSARVISGRCTAPDHRARPGRR